MIPMQIAKQIVSEKDPYCEEVGQILTDWIEEIIGPPIDLSRAEKEGWSKNTKLWQEAKWEYRNDMIKRIQKDLLEDASEILSENIERKN